MKVLIANDTNIFGMCVLIMCVLWYVILLLYSDVICEARQYVTYGFKFSNSKYVHIRHMFGIQRDSNKYRNKFIPTVIFLLISIEIFFYS